MKNKKLTGSFYTPKIIADFLVDYLSEKLRGNHLINALEPSAGDGMFVKTLLEHTALKDKIQRITAVEKEKKELEKIKAENKSKKLKPVNADFLKFQKNKREKFQLCIGNPPYIKGKLLSKWQRKECLNIQKEASLSENNPQNIWTAFLVSCIRLVDKEGVLAFVLPAELLQVKYAAELRKYLLEQFERVEIFTFNELLFNDCAGQDTLILIGERKSDNKGLYYCNIDKASDLEKRDFSLVQNIKVKDSKWTYHHLTYDEIDLLEKVKQNLKTVNHYSNSKPGIVTAANDYFIINEETAKSYSLQNYTKRIIQKGLFVNGSVVITEKDFNELITDSKPAFLLSFENYSAKKSNPKVRSYLRRGIKLEINNRYKTSIRDKWYKVPNIGTPPEAFFFKRCNEYPKLIKNDANVLSTDSAYVIEMKDGFNIDALIFSFYNSLTLSLAELNGRYYGGGVLELIPSEFKSLPIPYVNIDKKEFNDFVKVFKGKDSIKEICKMNDTLIFKTIDKNIDGDSVNKLYNIREKLSSRRLKTN